MEVCLIKKEESKIANKILILGESGTGKSTSMRNLDPKTTAIIQVVKKALPFKSKEFKAIASDDYDTIKRALKKIESNKEITTIVVDDSQYLMANQFMRRCKDKGFDKFSEIGNAFWDLLNFITDLRDDLNVYVMHHTEESDNKIKAKTIGKMLDNVITLEGLFTIVLRTSVEDGKYFFSTQNNGYDTVKSPMGMFESSMIENDLKMVNDKIKEFYE